MIAVVLVKTGVKFTTISPAGFRLLGAIERTARKLGVNLTITSACDGAHSGPDDPHHAGSAFDLRTHGLTPQQKLLLLDLLMQDLQADDAGDTITEVSGGLATRYFWGWIEHAGADNEHCHCQLRKGVRYPPASPSPLTIV